MHASHVLRHASCKPMEHARPGLRAQWKAQTINTVSRTRSARQSATHRATTIVVAPAATTAWAMPIVLAEPLDNA
ncbi:hypothetical protein CUJ88_36475 [Paraburkholderia hospita]|nr:hypothetical protein CUJ88_36475 [Paraburkholderia hospita]